MRHQLHSADFREDFGTQTDREGVGILAELPSLAVTVGGHVVGSRKVTDVSGHTENVSKGLAGVDGEAHEVGVGARLNRGVLVVRVGRTDRQSGAQNSVAGELVVNTENTGVDVAFVARAVKERLGFEHTAVGGSPDVHTGSTLGEERNTISNRFTHLVHSVHRHRLNTGRGAERGNIGSDLVQANRIDNSITVCIGRHNTGRARACVQPLIERSRLGVVIEVGTFVKHTPGRINTGHVTEFALERLQISRLNGHRRTGHLFIEKQITFKVQITVKLRVCTKLDRVAVNNVGQVNLSTLLNGHSAAEHFFIAVGCINCRCINDEQRTSFDLNTRSGVRSGPSFISRSELTGSRDMGAVGILCTLNIEDRVHGIGRRVFSCRVTKHKAGLGKRCISCCGVLKADSDNRVLTCNNGAARRNRSNSYRAVRLRNTVHEGRIREDLTIAGNTVNDQLTCSSIRADTDSCIVDDQSLDRRSNVTRELCGGSHGHRAVGSIKLAVNVQSSSLNITIGRRSCSRLTGSSNRSLRNAGGKLSALTNGQSVYIDECIRLKISTTQSLGNCQNTVISNSEGGAASTSFLQNCTNLCTAVGRTRGRERTAGGKNNTLNSRLGTAHRRDEVAGTVKCQSCAGNLGGIDVRRSLQLAVGTGGREASCGHTGNSSLAERIAGNTCQFGGHIAELNFAVCNCIRNGQRTEIQETVAAVGLLNFALNVSNYIHRRGNTGQIRKNQFAVVGDGTGIIGRTRIEGRTRCTDLEPKSSRSSFNRTAIFDLELRTTIRRQFGIDDELTGASVAMYPFLCIHFFQH